MDRIVSSGTGAVYAAQSAQTKEPLSLKVLPRKLLEDKDAAAALGEIGHADAIPYLEAAAGDPDPDVRKNIDWALRQIRAA